MSDRDVLVAAEGVGKKFCRDLKRSLWYGVKDSIGDLNPLARQAAIEGSELRPGEFWANQDICFEVRRGECLGIIGGNGAGKTTLLKMLNGLIKPDAGRLEIRGRVNALIALGAGFNPVLTARENVFVNGSLLGLSKSQVNDRLDEIVDFAEISEFLDSPVRSFSSGMSVRLGFGVAAMLMKPDVLILDEVLAVGDIGFKTKCLNKIRDLSADSAVILVSHSMPQIGSFASRILVMSKGRVSEDTGDVGKGIDHFISLFPFSGSPQKYGDASIELFSATLDKTEVSAEEGSDQYVHVELVLKNNVRTEKKIAFMLWKDSGEPVMQFGSVSVKEVGKNRVKASLDFAGLAGGIYRLHLVVRGEMGEIVLRVQDFQVIRVVNGRPTWAPLHRSIS